SVRNLFAAIDARRTIALNRLIYALGIRHVGVTNARLLALHYGTFDALREGARAAEPPKEKGDKGNDAWLELNSIEGIGPIVAEAVVEFFKEPHNIEELDRLLAQIEVAPMEQVKRDT